MKPSDSLFLLIQSLGRSEKIHFKKYTSKHVIDGMNNYTRLFDVIEKQKQYNEKAVKKIFKGTTSIKHLPSEKNYLYHLILKSLYVYNSGKSIDAILNELLEEAEILFEKNLFTQCHKLLLKAKKIAYQYEKFSSLITIIKCQIKYPDKMPTGHIDVLIKEQNKALKNLENEVQYSQMSTKMLNMHIKMAHTKNTYELNRLKKLIIHPLLANEKKAISFKAKCTFLNTHAIYTRTIGNNAQSYLFRKKLVALIESSPEKVRTNRTTYLNSLSNLMRILIVTKKYSEFLEVAKKTRNIFSVSESETISVFAVTYGLELAMYRDTGQFEKGIELIRQIEPLLEKYKRKLRKNDVLVFHRDISWIFFGANQFRKALWWTNKTLNDNDDAIELETNKYFIISTRIFSMIIHFELGNHDFLEHLVKATYHFLAKLKGHKVEMAILYFMEKFPNINTQQALTKEFIMLKEECISLLKDPLQQPAFLYFDYVSWIESKIENKSFAEIVRKKAKRL